LVAQFRREEEVDELLYAVPGFWLTWTFLTAGSLITVGIALLLLARPAVAFGIMPYGGALE
jgi:hypothetical protein